MMDSTTTKRRYSKSQNHFRFGHLSSRMRTHRTSKTEIRLEPKAAAGGRGVPKRIIDQAWLIKHL